MRKARFTEEQRKMTGIGRAAKDTAGDQSS
jgi:hypothetical protein